MTMGASGKLRFGIVGCGTIADIHARAMNASKLVELVSAYSRNKENAGKFGETHQVSWTTDWEQFIDNPDMDAVSICTPNGNHLDYGEKAARNGKHVVLEKPIEINLERGQQLIDICENHGVQLAVIYQNRFIPYIQEMKKRINAGEIGNLFIGDAYIKWYRTQAYYDSGAWRGSLKLDGGGVLINQAIHTVDLLQWMMGAVETIYGQTGTFTHERLEGEDNAAAVLRFKNGALGVIQGSTSVNPSQSRRIEIHGSKGTAILEGESVKIQTPESEPKIRELGEVATKSAGSSSPLGGFSTEPHRLQFEAIANAIVNGAAPPVSGADSLKSLAIVQAIYESAKTGQAIDMDTFVKNNRST